MGGGIAAPLRALPRVFLAGLQDPLTEAIELPKEEYEKFHKVLRLSSGSQVAVLPGDGRLIRCELRGHECVPIETVRPETESLVVLTLCLALSKPETLEESVRMATELGASKFVLFPSDRTVVKWDASKLDQKLGRLQRIAREAAEVSYRTKLPSFQVFASLGEALKGHPEAVVLSESDRPLPKLSPRGDMTLVIGPEGGWSPRELEVIGDRAVTLGPRVLRVDTAVATAAALALVPVSLPVG